MPLSKLTEREITVSGGRRLAVEISGAPTGFPVFLLHGTPGSRKGPMPRPGILYRLGVRLINYDRPGYGLSSRDPGRRVADAAFDVDAIADDLGLDQFAVVGRSGGGPHALACAALLPRRVVSTAVLVGLAPSNAAGLDWFEGMSTGNVRGYSEADRDRTRLVEQLRLRADRTTRDPESLLEYLRTQMAEADRRVVDSAVFRRLLTQTYVEGLRHGPYGWIDDVLALRAEWEFPFDTIAGRVLLWHGKEDTFTPLNHLWWLAGRLPGAEVRIQTDSAHFGAVEVLPRVLSWLTA